MVTTDQTALAVKDEPLAAYIRRPEIMEKFALLLPDREARRYVQNVIVLVETAEPGDYSLQSCSPRSIVRAALRAATQRVSVDPAEREAYLIPRLVKRKIGGAEKKVLEACFSFHYQEIENRAWRTNRYTDINVSPIYEGTEIYIDIYTGLHSLKTESGLEISRGSSKVLASWGKADGKKRIGWLGYYRTTRGREKTIYMTVEEIEAQVSLGNSYWKSSFGWTKFRETMERKTVLLALLRLADLKAPEMIAVKEALDSIDAAENTDGDTWDESEKTIDEKIIDGEARYVMDENAQAPEVVETIAPGISYEKAKTFIVKGKRLDAMSPAEIEAVMSDPKTAETTKDAARIVKENTPTNEQTERLFRYNVADITQAVASAWDEAPAKVAPILHEMYKAGELPENLTVSEAQLIKRPVAQEPLI